MSSAMMVVKSFLPLLVVFTQLLLLCGLTLVVTEPVCGFVSPARVIARWGTVATTSSSSLSQLAAKKAKSKKSGGSTNKTNKKTKADKPSTTTIQQKGFGSTVSKWDGCEDLRTWLTSRGGDVSGLNVGVVDPTCGLRGVSAARDFKRGDILFSIPRDVCIMDEMRADASSLAADIYPTVKELNTIPPSIRVAIYLLWLERNPTERDLWAPYLDSLPTPANFETDGGPMELWSKEELEQVECGQLISDVHERSVSLKKLYNDIVLPRWTEAAAASSSSLTGTIPPTFEEFQYAVAVVTSRSYASMLVPGVDLCNHSDRPPHVHHELSDEGKFLVTAAKPIAKGEEIKTSYGKLPNRMLLAQFGFLLPGQLVGDTAQVRVDSLFFENSDDDDDDRKPATVESEVAAGESWTKGPGPARLQALRAKSTDSGLRTANHNSSNRLISRWQPAVSAKAIAMAVSESEEEGLELYHDMVRRELASYSTSIEDDGAQLQLHDGGRPSLPVRKSLALSFRIHAKRLLEKELLP